MPRDFKAGTGIVLLVVAVFAAAAPARGDGVKPVAVRHPNLLLSREEIEQVKVKVKEHPWAARLLERVEEKAEKENAALEWALAYALTGEARYGRGVHERLLA